MSDLVLKYLTFKDQQAFFDEGGVGYLPTSRIRDGLKYVICVRHKNHEKSNFDSKSKHGSAFFIGKVKGYEKTNSGKKKEGQKRATYRGIIKLESYALLDDIDGLWKTQTSSMKYSTIAEINEKECILDTNAIKWIDFPNKVEPSASAKSSIPSITPLNKEEAQAALAAHYGVEVDKIKLTVELI